MWQAYEIATSVEGALNILACYGGRARLIAGGTDLVIELQEGKRQVECLVDITRIPGLDRIEQQGDWIVLGANVTFRQIKESPLLHERALVLAEAAATVAALQIQAVATLVGNVVNAMPAADGSVALIALDAQVEIADSSGRAWRPVGDLFMGPGRSAVDPARQMVTAVRFPALGAGQGSAWGRIGRRRALTLPILNCGVSAGLDDNRERFAWARIGLGPVATVPFRARQGEAFLAGKQAGDGIYEQAAEVAAGECCPRSSLLRASKEYRAEVLKVL
ncbi:MAG: FAD binding domain-containing protein, partial [Anaerolineae bacterium]|nr:FAD binding domain-containing protein [Anaerolineae bacterium]